MIGTEQRAKEALKRAEEAWEREIGIHGPTVVLPMVMVGMRYLRNGIGEEHDKGLIKAYEEAMQRMDDSFDVIIRTLSRIIRRDFPHVPFEESAADQGLVAKHVDGDPSVTVER